MISRLTFRTFGVTLTTQLLANGIGLGLMIALALALEHARRPTTTARHEKTRDTTATALKPLANTPAV